MCDLICDVIICCVGSCNTEEINVVYMIKSSLETDNKEHMEIEIFFYTNLHLKDGL